MNIDEQELRQRLGDVLEAVTPPPAPVSATVRRGRSMRARRRIGVAAGLAAAVGLAVAVPSLVRQADSPPVSPARPSVTVNPAGLNAPHGVIGSGKINGKNWRLVAQKPGTGGVPDTSQCFLAEGAAVSADQDCEPVPYAGAGDAVDLSSIFGSQAEIQFGVVAQGVDRITVTLADGTVLVLHPTEAYGQRYVAFAIPLPPTITTIVAYSRRAELSYAIPFNSATDSTTGVWLRPGQGGLPRASYRIGSGSVDGKSWSDTVHVGPWGYCITGADGGDCYATESVSLGNQVGPITDDGPSTTNYAVGTATAAVSYVRVTLSNGGLITARAVDAGGPRFFAFAIPKGDRLVKVTYCAASGRQLASQSASQIY